MGVVARPRQAQLWSLVWRRMESTMWTGQDGGREHFSGREKEMEGTGMQRCGDVGHLGLVHTA